MSVLPPLRAVEHVPLAVRRVVVEIRFASDDTGGFDDPAVVEGAGYRSEAMHFLLHEQL